jgi:hypothetical protein
MSYILIIDSSLNRATTIAAQFQTALPKIEIYRCYTTNGQIYTSNRYDADGLFYKSELPPQPAKLALWHYRDDRYIPATEPRIRVGFGGGGKESYPGFLQHIAPKLSTAEDVKTVLTIDNIQDLWVWTSEPRKMTWRLQRLLKSEHNQSALIAIQILCQAYLTVYGDLQSPVVDGNAIAQHRDRVNLQDWWLSPLNAIEDWHNLAIDDAEIDAESTVVESDIGHHVSKQLVKAIQHPEKWAALNPNLRQVCKQYLQECNRVA